MSIRVEESHLLNEFEIIQVMDSLREQGIQHAVMRPGNDCIWVTYGVIDCYYLFRQGKIVDIQYD